MILVALVLCLCIWKIRHLFQFLHTGFSKECPSPVSLSKDSCWAIRWHLQADLMMESSGRLASGISQQVGGPRIWIHKDGLAPVFTGAGLVPRSTVVGLAFDFAWAGLELVTVGADRAPESTRASLAPGSTGEGLVPRTCRGRPGVGVYWE